VLAGKKQQTGAFDVSLSGNKSSIGTKLFDNQLEGLPLLYSELKQFVCFVKPVNQSRGGSRLFSFQKPCVQKIIFDVVQQA
jgi:hypothetical protein